MVKPTRARAPRPFGPSTAQRVHATLRAALNAAVRAEEITRNVAVFAEIPRVTRRKVKPWEPEELGGWLDGIAEHRLYALFHLGAFAGLRRGELCGLAWDDVNLDAERLEVWWQITGVSYRKARAAARRGESIFYRAVFGQIITCQNGRTLLLRGKDAARAEWRLLAACHNLLKIFRHSAVSGLVAATS